MAPGPAPSLFSDDGFGPVVAYGEFDVLKSRQAAAVYEAGFEVLWFEQLCAEAPDVRDRVFSGYVLFLVFGRA